MKVLNRLRCICVIIYRLYNDIVPSALWVVSVRRNGYEPFWSILACPINIGSERDDELVYLNISRGSPAGSALELK